MNKVIAACLNRARQGHISISLKGTNGLTNPGRHPSEESHTESFYLDEDQARALAMVLVEFFEDGSTLASASVTRSQGEVGDFWISRSQECSANQKILKRMKGDV